MLAKCVGTVVFFLISYFALSALILFASYLLFLSGTSTQLPWFYDAEKFLNSRLRNIWQTQVGCVVFDEILIYKPADGRCVFRNIEFDTVLEFSNGIRKHESIKSAMKGIAVIGDSHAMGWGVNDNETFSSLLQTKLQRPVFNLAVSSYGTVREVLALEKSGVSDEVDTVIIQYCENDIGENLYFKLETNETRKLKFTQMISRSDSGEYSLPSSLRFMQSTYTNVLKVPFMEMKNYIKGDDGRPDFTRHYQPLLSVIKDRKVFEGKTVIIFYSNGHGARFVNFPNAKDRNLASGLFVDLNIERDSYFVLDDHLTKKGHEFVADKLAQLLR